MAKPEYFSLVKRGSRGPDAAMVQSWLNSAHTDWTAVPAVTVDGIFGARTDAAVRIFQGIYGITVDGKVGVRTWNALYAKHALVYSDEEIYPGKVILRGHRGAAVRSAQIQLNKAGYSLNADGIFGAKTEAAVYAYQRYVGLGRDGKIGPYTWAALHAVTKSK